MASPYWMKTLIKKIYGARFFVSGLTHYRPIGWLIDRLLFKDDNVVFVPKDTVIAVNEEAGAPTGVAAPSEIVEHFIREASFIWIMDFCICRDSEKCGDYPVSHGCVFLGPAAAGINPKFGRPARVEEALDHVRRCREAGLIHMIGRNQLDTVWLNIGPPEKLMTICNCCPCCCLWQVLPYLNPDISGKISRIPGIRMEVSENCNGCGVCANGICFVGAIHVKQGSAVIDQDQCRGCGRCVSVCPGGAVDMIVENDAFVENAIKRLSKSADTK